MFWSVKRRFKLHRLSWVNVFVVLCVLVLIWWRFGSSQRKSLSVTNTYRNTEGYSFSWNEEGFSIARSGQSVLNGKLGHSYNSRVNPKPCDKQSQCAIWPEEGDTKVHEYKDKGTQCYDVLSKGHSSNDYPTDCFDIGNEEETHWYGGAETYHDRWPIVMTIKERPHVSDTGGYGSVIERYWFSNKGIAIFVDDLVPLFVKANTRQFCLIGRYDGHIFQNWDGDYPYLNYTICVKENIKSIHTYMLERYISNPKGIPDEKMIKYPVWSTWAKYKSFITQEMTIQFTNEIAEHGFPACQIEVDDKYTINYGDYVFDPQKFPNPKSMIDHIHSKGFRVTVWTHPFSNEGTASYIEGKDRGFWVMDETGSHVGKAGWWRGYGGVLDVTNINAVKWFFWRLDRIHELGVDGHKYDAGEIGFLPKKFRTKKLLKNPCHYSSIYAETMHNYTNRFMQVRVGYKTQHLPIFVSMMDRASDWGYNMGLKSVITTSLVFGSMGYYFIMPDMIGGNAYCGGNMDCRDVKPSRELFIRWLQLNTFLPMMQFSFTPWQYDPEVVTIAKRYVDLHSDYVAPKIIALGKESIVTGYPIIRPMWWVAPDDHTSHTIDSQFMVGDDLLVAPILEEHATSRNVYLPQGSWRNVLTGVSYHVQQDAFYLRGVKALLGDIPYFERI